VLTSEKVGAGTRLTRSTASTSQTRTVEPFAGCRYPAGTRYAHRSRHRKHRTFPPAATPQRGASGHARAAHLAVPVPGVGGAERVLLGRERRRDDARHRPDDHDSGRHSAEPSEAYTGWQPCAEHRQHTARHPVPSSTRAGDGPALLQVRAASFLVWSSVAVAKWREQRFSPLRRLLLEAESGPGYRFWPARSSKTPASTRIPGSAHPWVLQSLCSNEQGPISQ
jgi:hypothetical protein